MTDEDKLKLELREPHRSEILRFCRNCGEQGYWHVLILSEYTDTKTKDVVYGCDNCKATHMYEDLPADAQL
jgi:hypothetical protein